MADALAKQGVDRISPFVVLHMELFSIAIGIALVYWFFGSSDFSQGDFVVPLLINMWLTDFKKNFSQTYQETQLEEF